MFQNHSKSLILQFQKEIDFRIFYVNFAFFGSKIHNYSHNRGQLTSKPQHSFIILFCFVSPGFMADFVVGRKLKRSHAFH